MGLLDCPSSYPMGSCHDVDNIERVGAPGSCGCRKSLVSDDPLVCYPMILSGSGRGGQFGTTLP
eukprot:895940-Prorocentrum_lima.AAC.1